MIRDHYWVAWVAQSVKRLALAQVMISRLMGLSPPSGSVLTAQSLEPASASVSVSVSLCPFPTYTLSLAKIHVKKRDNYILLIFKEWWQVKGISEDIKLN